LSVVLLLAGSCGGGGAAPSSQSVKARDSSSAKSRKSRKAATDSLGKAASTVAAKAGKLARGGRGKGKSGSLKGLTPEERAAERKRQREEKTRLKRELRRKRREEAMSRRVTGTRGRKNNKSRRGSLYDVYMLKGTIAGRYALIGSRRLERGDVIAGKKLVEVSSDRITLEQFGSRYTIRVGEPVERNLDVKKRNR